jgi:hypothetical protein
MENSHGHDSFVRVMCVVKCSAATFPTFHNPHTTDTKVLPALPRAIADSVSEAPPLGEPDFSQFAKSPLTNSMHMVRENTKRLYLPNDNNAIPKGKETGTVSEGVLTQFSSLHSFSKRERSETVSPTQLFEPESKRRKLSSHSHFDTNRLQWLISL